MNQNLAKGRPELKAAVIQFRLRMSPSILVKGGQLPTDPTLMTIPRAEASLATESHP